VLSLVWSVPAGLLARLLPRQRGAAIGQFAIMAGFRLILGVMVRFGVFRCDLSALDALRDERGLIIVPNHPSMLDAVLVISRLPRVVCITKASLWHNWFLGGGIRLAGYVPNDAKVTLVKRALDALRSGRHLLVFPEGTRTETPPVGAFGGGFALMAKQAGAAVQTVFLDVSPPYLAKGDRLFRRPALPIICRARLGRRFEVTGDVHDFVTGLRSYFAQELGTPSDPA
jgi:1-acyl-sn-glycerol-3-phosphate acyltransferase